MEADEVIAKAEGLIAPVLGSEKTARLIESLVAIDRLDDVRKLRPLLRFEADQVRWVQHCAP